MPLKSRIQKISCLFAMPLFCLLAFAPVYAQPPLSDGPQGMTCNTHFAAAQASWQRRGGDWIDAQGKLHGTEPFASAAIRPSSKRQIIEWDVTSLARSWSSGAKPAGALFLSALPKSPDGSVNFRSRENADPEVHPTLIIEWADGDKSSLIATADTSINCTTIKSLGGGSMISVGGNDTTIVVFPFTSQPQRKINRARLQLTTDKQWGRGSDVGVYQLLPPWAHESPVRNGLAAAYPGDRNISTDPAVYFSTGFDESNWAGRWSHAGRSGKTTTVTAAEGNGFKPLQGPALRTTLTPSANFALDLRYGFAKLHGEEPEEAYFRYYLRFGDNWNPTRDGGKLPGFGGTYDRGGWGMRKSDGFNGWSARGSFIKKAENNQDMHGLAAIGSYVYHADIKGAESANWGWGLGPTGLLRQNQWYSIEQYVKMNDPGQPNGELRAWIDGHLVFEKKNIRFRDTTDLKVENIWFNVYHGGVAKPHQEMSLYIDNVVIARDYIGPMVDK